MLVTESEVLLYVTAAGIVIAPEIPGFATTLAVFADVTVYFRPSKVKFCASACCSPKTTNNSIKIVFFIL
jgi:hypothetical protein